MRTLGHNQESAGRVMSREKFVKGRRWVVKVGSSLVTNNGLGLDRVAISHWARQLVASCSLLWAPSVMDPPKNTTVGASMVCKCFNISHLWAMMEVVGAPATGWLPEN